MLKKIFEGVHPSLANPLEARLYGLLITLDTEKVADVKAIIALASHLKKESK